jgi:adenylate kinase
MSDHFLRLIMILLGPPGCGKGTQAKLLTKEYCLPHISTGDLFREHILSCSSIGIKAKEFIEMGHLVPDDIVFQMLFERIQRADCQSGYLLDGFPRTLSQAEKLNLNKMTTNVPVVISLEVPDEEIIQRVMGRIVCQTCGHIYHLSASPPAIAGVCDQCQSFLYRRTDDEKEIISKRLHVYHEQTHPVIHYYQKKGLLISFNGLLPPLQVFAKLKAYIDSQKETYAYNHIEFD